MTVLISYSIRDADSDVSSFPVYVRDTGVTHADIAGYADDLAVLLDGVIDGVITGINITYQHSLPGGLNGTPVAFSEVQKGALLGFSATGTPYTHSMRVPAFTPSLFAADAVISGTPPVSTFVTAITTGLTPVATPVIPTNKYDMDIIALTKAVKSFRK